MKSIIIPLFTFTFGLHLASAAVPLTWTVETTRAQPATFEAYQGETLCFEAALMSRGKPLVVSGLAAFYWQTNGMASAYWETTAAVNSNRFTAVFTPEMDVGAKVYNCFIGIPGTVYHAAFQLRLRPSPGATPNVLPLPVPVIDFAKVRVLNPPWESGGGGGVNTNAVLDIIHATVDGAARPLPKYLHIYDADDSYPDAAAEYYRQRQGGGAVPAPQCSAVRSGGYLSRNFDFPFDERSEFVVRMSAGPNRFASVGVAQVGTNLTEAIVTSGKPSRWYKALSGATVDGINERGVVAEINVVDGTPPRRLGGDIHPLAAVRWALDNGTSAHMVATSLAARIQFPAGWSQNYHWMIADETSTYIVENGAASNVTAVAAKRVMTNFPILPDDYSGMGAERYQLLRGGASITNAWFTRCYERSTNPPWLSEFGDNYEYWNAALNSWELKPKEAHRGEIVNGESWWQTVHTSIYDITNRVLRVAVQEVDDWYTFAVPSAGGVKPDAVREIVQPMIKDATNGLLSAESDPTATAKANAAIVAAGLDCAVKTNENGQVQLTGITPGVIMGSTEYNGPSIYNMDFGLLNFPWSSGYGLDPSHDFATRADIPDVSGFVPYTGATNDVDLGEKKLNADELSFTGTDGYVRYRTTFSNESKTSEFGAFQPLIRVECSYGGSAGDQYDYIYEYYLPTYSSSQSNYLLTYDDAQYSFIPTSKSGSIGVYQYSDYYSGDPTLTWQLEYYNAISVGRNYAAFGWNVSASYNYSSAYGVNVSNYRNNSIVFGAAAATATSHGDGTVNFKTGSLDLSKVYLEDRTLDDLVDAKIKKSQSGEYRIAEIDGEFHIVRIDYDPGM